VVHGLGGSHRSGGVQRLAAALLARRARVFCVDLRGAGDGAALARRSYYGGCSEDVRAALEAVAQWCPSSPLALVGLSLGGNIVLKLAAESAARPVPNLDRVAAANPPIDLLRCSDLLARPRNRLYEAHFVRGLVQQARTQRRHFPDLPPLRFPHGLALRCFDDLYTAPSWGFADALDYYRRASSAPLLDRISLPTLILTARDDPFVAVELFEALGPSPGRTVHIAERGGHLGFLGRDGNGGIRWAERHLADWCLP
jgi:predicted alpha/beta-fold hydrolase